MCVLCKNSFDASQWAIQMKKIYALAELRRLFHLVRYLLTLFLGNLKDVSFGVFSSVCGSYRGYSNRDRLQNNIE